MADDVIVMYTSQAMERGSVFDIFDRMTHPYTMGLFGSRPSMSKMKGKLSPIRGTVPPMDQYPEGCRFNTRCPYVMNKCMEGEVPDFPIKNSKEHRAKCWLCE